MTEWIFTGVSRGAPGRTLPRAASLLWRWARASIRRCRNSWPGPASTRYHNYAISPAIGAWCAQRLGWWRARRSRMDKIVVEGGVPLRGEVTVSGSKNAALPIMMAALLTPEPVTIGNVPRLRDVTTALLLLERVGVEYRWVDR